MLVQLRDPAHANRAAASRSCPLAVPALEGPPGGKNLPLAGLAVADVGDGAPHEGVVDALTESASLAMMTPINFSTVSEMLLASLRSRHCDQKPGRLRARAVDFKSL